MTNPGREITQTVAEMSEMAKLTQKIMNTAIINKLNIFKKVEQNVNTRRKRMEG